MSLFVAHNLPSVKTFSTFITLHHFLMASEIFHIHFLGLGCGADFVLCFNFLASRFSETCRPRKKINKTDPAYKNIMACYCHAIITLLKYILVCKAICVMFKNELIQQASLLKHNVTFLATGPHSAQQSCFLFVP